MWNPLLSVGWSGGCGDGKGGSGAIPTPLILLTPSGFCLFLTATKDAQFTE